MKTIVFYLLIFYLGTWASCNKDFDCRGTIYSFEAFYKAYPDKDSIKINDTIWIESNTPTQLKDLISNRMVDYSGAANLGTAIDYLEILGGDFNNPGVIPSANN